MQNFLTLIFTRKYYDMSIFILQKNSQSNVMFNKKFVSVLSKCPYIWVSFYSTEILLQNLEKG